MNKRVSYIRRVDSWNWLPRVSARFHLTMDEYFLGHRRWNINEREHQIRYTFLHRGLFLIMKEIHDYRLSISLFVCLSVFLSVSQSVGGSAFLFVSGYVYPRVLWRDVVACSRTRHVLQISLRFCLRIYTYVEEMFRTSRQDVATL